MKLLLFILALVTSSIAFAASAPNLRSETIETTGLKVFEKNEKLFFITSNGRFVIEGEATDVWTKEKIKTLDKLNYNSSHIDLKKMGLAVENLNTITMGTGEKLVTVFVDPLCDKCKEFIKSAKSKLDDYTFRIIVIPALGDKSQVHARALFCSSNKKDALSQLLNSTLNTLPQKNPCDTKNYDLTLLTATLFNIKAVPWFIADDGRTKYGVSPDLWTWF